MTNFRLQVLQAQLEEYKKQESNASYALQAAQKDLDALQTKTNAMQASSEEVLRQVLFY